MNGTSPKITFWTNHGCPWAQRAQIVLKELEFEYEEVEIDLDTPREDWYLKINPVGRHRGCRSLKKCFHQKTTKEKLLDAPALS